MAKVLCFWCLCFIRSASDASAPGSCEAEGCEGSEQESSLLQLSPGDRVVQPQWSFGGIVPGDPLYQSLLLAFMMDFWLWDVVGKHGRALGRFDIV